MNSLILYVWTVTNYREEEQLKEFRVELARQLNRQLQLPPVCHASRPKRMKVPHYPIKNSRGRCKACYKGRMFTTTWWCQRVLHGLLLEAKEVGPNVPISVCIRDIFQLFFTTTLNLDRYDCRSNESIR